MTPVETETPKKEYKPLFDVATLDFPTYGIEFGELSERNLKSLQNRQRTTVLQLKDPANNAITVEGRLLVKKVGNDWTLYPEYKNKSKLVIHDIVMGAIITDEDKKNILAGKSVEKSLIGDDGKPFDAIIVLDKELNRVLIITKKNIPSALLNTKLSEKQLNDLFLGKPILVKGTSKEGKNIARVFSRDVLTGSISTDYPNAKGEAINKTQTTKIEPTQTKDEKVVKSEVTTKVESKTEPEPEVAKAENLDVYKDKINSRKPAKAEKEVKPKKKSTVKL